MHPILLMTRRAILVSLLIFLNWIGSLGILIIMASLQVVHIILLLGMKPYTSAINNSIEFTNELFFLGFLLWYFFFKTEDKWTKGSTNAFIGIMMFNNCIVLILVLVNFSKLMKKMYKDWKRGKGCFRFIRRRKIIPYTLDDMHRETNLLKFQRVRNYQVMEASFERQECIPDEEEIVRNDAEDRKHESEETKRNINSPQEDIKTNIINLQAALVDNRSLHKSSPPVGEFKDENQDMLFNKINIDEESSSSGNFRLSEFFEQSYA